MKGRFDKGEGDEAEQQRRPDVEDAERSEADHGKSPTGGSHFEFNPVIKQTQKVTLPATPPQSSEPQQGRPAGPRWTKANILAVIFGTLATIAIAVATFGQWLDWFD